MKGASSASQKFLHWDKMGSSYWNCKKWRSQMQPLRDGMIYPGLYPVVKLGIVLMARPVVPMQRSVQHLPSTPETEDESSAGYYTNVKVYKPQETTPATTKTTTTTTTQAPPTLEAAPPPPSVPDRRRNRPLVYSKRNRYIPACF